MPAEPYRTDSHGRRKVACFGIETARKRGNPPRVPDVDTDVSNQPRRRWWKTLLRAATIGVVIPYLLIVTLVEIQPYGSSNAPWMACDRDAMDAGITVSSLTLRPLGDAPGYTCVFTHDGEEVILEHEAWPAWVLHVLFGFAGIAFVWWTTSPKVFFLVVSSGAALYALGTWWLVGEDHPWDRAPWDHTFMTITGILMVGMAIASMLLRWKLNGKWTTYPESQRVRRSRS
jgi:hypothetical protein